jgi:hypothetical protein
MDDVRVMMLGGMWMGHMIGVWLGGGRGVTVCCG